MRIFFFSQPSLVFGHISAVVKTLEIVGNGRLKALENDHVVLGFAEESAVFELNDVVAKDRVKIPSFDWHFVAVRFRS